MYIQAAILRPAHHWNLKNGNREKMEKKLRLFKFTELSVKYSEKKYEIFIYYYRIGSYSRIIKNYIIK